MKQLWRTVLLLFVMAGPAYAEPTELMRNYTYIAHHRYKTAADDAQKLKDAVDALVKNPTQQTMNDARGAWLAARVQYMQAEVFRFTGSPIDQNRPSMVEFTNAWPVNEARLDFFDGIQKGRVQDGSSLDIGFLREQNQRSAADDVTVGYHVIEYLLWGMDWNEGGPADRSFMDFALGKSKQQRLENERRRIFLTNVTQSLVDDLRWIEGAWVPHTNYAQQLLDMPEKDMLGKMITGMATLANKSMAKERIRKGLTSGDQRWEESRFSDNTTEDLKNCLRGIRSVYYGKINDEDVIGDSINLRIRAISPTLDDQVIAQMEMVMAKLEALPVPFDRVLASPTNSPERKQAEQLVQELFRLGQSMRQVGSALGAQVSVD